MLQTSPGTAALSSACDTLNLIFLAQFLLPGLRGTSRRRGIRKPSNRSHTRLISNPNSYSGPLNRDVAN